MKTVLSACVALLVASGAMAQQTVFRCGPDGRQYSHAPCPSGAALELDDTRTADQQRQAKSAVDRDARLAHALAQERRVREAVAAHQGAAYLRPARSNATESAATSQKHRRNAGHKASDESPLTPPLRSPANAR